MEKLIKVLSVFLVVVLSISLVGCSEKGIPTRKVEEVLDAYIAKDFSKINEVFDSEVDKEVDNMSDELEKLLVDKLTDISYEVTEEIIKEDKATVKIKANVNDLATAFEKAIEEGISESELLTLASKGDSEDEISKVYENKLKEKLTKDLQKIDKSATVKLTKIDKEWVIDKKNNEILDIFLGVMGELN